MRVIEIEFVRDVKYGPPGGGVKTKSLFRSPEHTMLWLPTEGTLMIDGWRVVPGEGTRWRVEMPAPPPNVFETLPAGALREAAIAMGKETDGAAQPGQPGRPARGKKRRG
jgi:hypothetical protein